MAASLTTTKSEANLRATTMRSEATRRFQVDVEKTRYIYNYTIDVPTRNNRDFSYFPYDSIRIFNDTTNLDRLGFPPTMKSALHTSLIFIVQFHSGRKKNNSTITCKIFVFHSDEIQKPDKNGSDRDTLDRSVFYFCTSLTSL